MSKQFYFKECIWASVDSLVQFQPRIRPNPMLPQRAIVDLGARSMKGYSAFPKAPALLEPQHQIV